MQQRHDPAAAEVSLTLHFPELDKTAVLTRNVKTAKTFTLEPEDAGVRALLEEAAQHPELTLSRREIIKYILVEAGERSKEIQALLKLEAIGNIRSVLATAKNKVASAYTAGHKDTANANDALRRHLDVKDSFARRHACCCQSTTAGASPTRDQGAHGGHRAERRLGRRRTAASVQQDNGDEGSGSCQREPDWIRGTRRDRNQGHPCGSGEA